MKYRIEKVTELGNEVFPCYEVTVRQIPNILQRIFGTREEEFLCVSDLGLDWYILGKTFQRIEFNTPLDRLLITIIQEKRRKQMQLFFENLQDIKIRAVSDYSKTFVSSKGVN